MALPSILLPHLLQLQSFHQVVNLRLILQEPMVYQVQVRGLSNGSILSDSPLEITDLLGLGNQLLLLRILLLELITPTLQEPLALDCLLDLSLEAVIWQERSLQLIRQAQKEKKEKVTYHQERIEMTWEPLPQAMMGEDQSDWMKNRTDRTELLPIYLLQALYLHLAHPFQLLRLMLDRMVFRNDLTELLVSLICRDLIR